MFLSFSPSYVHHSLFIYHLRKTIVKVGITDEKVCELKQRVKLSDALGLWGYGVRVMH